jgi:hypothetical protein
VYISSAFPAFAKHKTVSLTALRVVPPPESSTSVPLRFSPGNQRRKTTSSAGGNAARRRAGSSRVGVGVGDDDDGDDFCGFVGGDSTPFVA